mgnify:CR=1 FL=1
MSAVTPPQTTVDGAAASAARRVELRPVGAQDHPLLHRWVTSPHAVYWEMTEAGLADVVAEYEAIIAVQPLKRPGPASGPVYSTEVVAPGEGDEPAQDDTDLLD